jgi:hypothetical protein
MTVILDCCDTHRIESYPRALRAESASCAEMLLKRGNNVIETEWPVLKTDAQSKLRSSKNSVIGSGACQGVVALDSPT